MIRMILVSLALAPSAFAGDRSLQQANPSAPMYHAGEAAYVGYCPTNPAYCVKQSYNGPNQRRSSPTRRHVPTRRHR